MRKAFRPRLRYGICLDLRPSITVFWTLCPVVFECLGTGALVNSSVCRLISLVRNDSF